MLNVTLAQWTDKSGTCKFDDTYTSDNGIEVLI